MRAGLRTAVLAAFAACLVLPFAYGEGSSPASGGSSVARALLDAARQAAGVGDWETAASCLGTAVAEDPGDADILYLCALASVKRGMPFAPALSDLDAALGTGRFSYYSRRDASVLKAELLVRERRWKEALDALGSPGDEAIADPAYRLARAKALSGMGDARAFASEIGDDLRRFPDQVAFARLFIAKAGILPASAQERALGEIIVGRLPRYAISDGELPVLAAPLMPALSSRRDAILAYRASGGKSAMATLRALEYGIIDESSASAEMLSGSYPVALGDLSSLMALAGSPAGREAVFTGLSAWSGTILIDADSDGVFEGSFSLSKGLVSGWSRDSRQEGTVDERGYFEEGLPTEIRLSRGGIGIDIVYSSYPAVALASFEEKGERRSYTFGPEALAFAPLEMRQFAGSGRSAILLPYAAAFSDPTERSCEALALSVETSSGDKREVTLLEKGLPVSETTYVGDRIYSKRSYEKGRPILEKVDADGDGRFETERGFVQDADGSWKVGWVRTDSDGDGVFEYREQTVFPYLKQWDYDGNGSVDALQFQLADGSTRKEFSSRLDGHLDEAVVVKEGKIVSFSRNGAALDLIPDSNRELTWIGRKIFDLGRNLPAGEGIYSYAGKRYTLLRIGAYAFAELIQ